MTPADRAAAMAPPAAHSWEEPGDGSAAEPPPVKRRRRRRSKKASALVLGALPPDELAAIVADLARAATHLVETADALVTAPAAARPALRATLHRWQTVLALGAQRLAQAPDDRA
jgi:hypothetical protein